MEESRVPCLLDAVRQGIVRGTTVKPPDNYREAFYFKLLIYTTSLPLPFCRYKPAF